MFFTSIFLSQSMKISLQFLLYKLPSTLLTYFIWWVRKIVKINGHKMFLRLRAAFYRLVLLLSLSLIFIHACGWIKWMKLVKIRSNLSKKLKTCPKRLNLVQIISNLSKLVQTCIYHFKLCYPMLYAAFWAGSSSLVFKEIHGCNSIIPITFLFIFWICCKFVCTLK